MSVITTVHLVIIGVGVLITSPETRKVVSGGKTVEIICHWDTPWKIVVLLYSLTLIVVCVALAFKARKLPERFQRGALHLSGVVQRSGGVVGGVAGVVCYGQQSAASHLVHFGRGCVFCDLGLSARTETVLSHSRRDNKGSWELS